MSEPNTIHVRVPDVLPRPRLTFNPFVMAAALIGFPLFLVAYWARWWSTEIERLGRVPWEWGAALLLGIVVGLVLTWLQYRDGVKPLVYATILTRPPRWGIIRRLLAGLIFIGPMVALQIGMWIIEGFGQASFLVPRAYLIGCALGLLAALPLDQNAWRVSCLVVRKANAARRTKG